MTGEPNFESERPFRYWWEPRQVIVAQFSGENWLIGCQIMNVEVPFYFKSIVDSMNVDFAAIGGTAWTVAGSMIIACMQLLCAFEEPFSDWACRWYYQNRRYPVPGAP